jgi:tetratricopeptide (TPR) repeat protein
MLGVYKLGALLDLGRIADALEMADELLDVAIDRYTKPIAIDTVASLWLISGRVQALRYLIDEFDGGVGAAGLAKSFRKGQLARLDGDYELGMSLFRGCVEGLGDHERSSGGAGAALVEMGRLCSVQGKHSEALSLYEKAATQWEIAGRIGEKYRAEAYRARAMLSLGNVHFLSSGLSGSIQYAKDHGLALLESECRLARGLSRLESGEEGASEDLNSSVYMAWECGARLQAGEARLERFCVGAGEENDLARASRELADDLPMLERLRELLKTPINEKLQSKEDR